MPDRGRLAALLAIGAYNLIQNLVVPVRAYVPANLAASLGLVALARRHGCSWDDLGLKPSKARIGFQLGVVGVAASAAVAVAAGTNRTTRKYLLDERAARQGGRDVAYRVLVRLPLGTALFEEVAFRGVVYGMWRRSGASPRKSAAAAAITFGIWHLIPANQALTGNPLGPRFTSCPSRVGVVVAGALLTSLSSFGFSWMRERSGSLLAPWMTHAAINSAGYLAGVAAWRRTAPDPSDG
jgi:membrane protease YdiL (CAAX protease family)